MARFFVAGKFIDLPGIPIHPKSPPSDITDWELGAYVTVRLLAPVSGIRAHTNNRSFPGRDPSKSIGAWVALGDVIQTSSELAGTRSLPTTNHTSMVAFTHSNEVTIPAQCVVNIGLASPKFGGVGGGFQAQYVSGPAFVFIPFHGKYWHGHSGNA